jgi:hypothetical protein
MTWSPSLECEAAVFEINSILADATRLRTTTPGRTSRRTRRLGRRSSAERTLTMALVAIVSTAEEFGSSLIARLIENEMPRTNIASENLWNLAIGTSFRSWETQLPLWKWFGVAVAASGEYKSLDGFIAARNSAMHGMGTLTRIQLRNNNTRTAIESCGIGFIGNRVIIDENAVRLCRMRAVEFVLWLDSAVLPIRVV